MNQKHRTFSRGMGFPNVALLQLNEKVKLEIHEYPSEIDGESLDMNGAPEIEEVDDNRYIIRGWGFKIMITKNY